MILRENITTVLGATIVFLISNATLFARPERKIMRIIVGEYTYENIILRILALTIPLFIGWIQLMVEENHLYTREVATAIFAFATYLFSIFLIARATLIENKTRIIKKIAHQETKRQKEELKIIINNIREGVEVIDAKGNFSFCNDTSNKLFGDILPWHNSENKTRLSILSPDNTIIHHNELPIFQSLNGNVAELKEIIIKSVDHPEGIWLSVKAFPILDEERNVNGAISIFRDITNLKQSEKLHNKERIKLKTVLKSLGEGVVVSDKNGKILLQNKKAAYLAGVKSKNTEAKDWAKTLEVFYPDQKTIFKTEDLPLFRALNGESNTEVEMYFNGRKIKATANPIYDKDDKIIGGVAVFREIK